MATANLTAKLDRIKNYATRYEVVAVHLTGAYRSFLIGYTARKSLPGLLATIRMNGEKLCNLLGVTDDHRMNKLPGSALDLGNGWTVKFSGRTQRDAYLEGELSFVGTMTALEAVKTTITADTSPVAAVRHAVAGGKFIIRLDRDNGPGRRSGSVLDDAGNVIGDASDYIYGGRGYAVHTAAYAGFVSESEAVYVEAEKGVL